MPAAPQIGLTPTVPDDDDGVFAAVGGGNARVRGSEGVRCCCGGERIFLEIIVGATFLPPPSATAADGRGVLLGGGGFSGRPADVVVVVGCNGLLRGVVVMAPPLAEPKHETNRYASEFLQ